MDIDHYFAKKLAEVMTFGFAHLQINSTGFVSAMFQTSALQDADLGADSMHECIASRLS